MDPTRTAGAPEPLRIEPLGDRALLLVLGDTIDAAVNDGVHGLAERLRASALPGVHDLVPAYATLAVHYDPLAWAQAGQAPHLDLAGEIQRLWREAPPTERPSPRPVEIPVAYGGAWGPDLQAVAEHCGLSAEEVVARHAAVEYRVFMLGFAPGFPYLGGLDPALATPRRSTPRLRVPAGSVGIAGAQTGIYPMATPGGWQIIGRTPLSLFDPAAAEPCLLRPGDRLRFVPVDSATLQEQDGGPA